MLRLGAVIRVRDGCQLNESGGDILLSSTLSISETGDVNKRLSVLTMNEIF